MQRFSRLFLTLGAVPAVAFAGLFGGSKPPPEDPSFTVLKSLVTEVGPRFTGSAGGEKAVDWALRKMRAMGFVHVHTESASVPHWVRGAIKLKMSGGSVQPLDAVALGGSIATPADGVFGDVVRVDSLEQLEYLPDEQVRGRIVFFDGRMARTNDGDGYRQAVPQRYSGPTRAARKGALAVVIRSVGTGDLPVAHTGTTHYDDDNARVPAAALTPQGADALEKALAAGPVSLQMVLEAQSLPETEADSVIGDIAGKTDEIVLLGAHLDSWDITPGANDDGAGVATVLEAARQIMAKGIQPTRTIRVVLFANEEFGQSGAKAYVMAHEKEIDKHVLAMEADLGSGPLIRLDAKVPQDMWGEVGKLAQAAGVSLGTNGHDGGTDVGPLRAKGVPVLSPVADATEYFDIHHTTADTLERVNQAGLAKNATAYARFAWLASESPKGFGRLVGTERDGHVLQWADLKDRPQPEASPHLAYGTEPQQFGELRLPAGKGPFPVAIVVHGGCWSKAFDLEHIAPVSAALTASGIATWTIEYRRVGDAGGGWPGTFQDVAAAADELKKLAKANPLDLKRVVAVGHSAGGQLALWLAARGAIAPDNAELYRKKPLALSGVVALAPITDLAAYASTTGCGELVVPLMAGTPAEQAARYAQVSPMLLPPPAIPVKILHGALDPIVPPSQSQAYAKHAPATELQLLDDTGHFEALSVASGEWPRLVAAVQSLVAAKSGP